MNPPSPPSLEDIVGQIRGWSERTRTPDPAFITTIPFIIGAGTATITTGNQGVIPIDFRCRITGIRVLEFDGITGSVTLDIQKTTDPSLVTPSIPTFTTIVGATAVPTIVSGRFYKDPLIDGNPGLVGWKVNLERGDYLLLKVLTVSSFRRLSIALRVRRK